MSLQRWPIRPGGGSRQIGGADVKHRRQNARERDQRRRQDRPAGAPGRSCAISGPAKNEAAGGVGWRRFQAGFLEANGVAMLPPSGLAGREQGSFFLGPSIPILELPDSSGYGDKWSSQ